MADLGSTLQTLLFAAPTTFLPLQALSMSQSQSSPQVCPLKPEYPYPDSVCTSQGISWEGECSDGHGPSVLVSLSSACCKLAGALSSEPLNLPICPSWSPGWLRVFPGWGNISSFTASSQGCSSYPNSFFSFFLLGYVVIFLTVFIVWDVLSEFSRQSARTIPHVDIFLKYL